MKRLVLTLLVVLAGWAVMAQNDSVPQKPMEMNPSAVYVGSQVVDSLAQPQEPKLMGSPIYYNDESQTNEVQYYNGRDGYIADDGNFYAYHRPRHIRGSYINPFSTYFFEITTLLGSRDFALGGTFAYVPDRFGGYATYMSGVVSDWFSLGGVWRLSDEDNRTDIQLYGGLAMGLGYGGEVGVRLAWPNYGRRNTCSLWSTSLGMMNVDGVGYCTVGVSVALAVCTTLWSIWLF